MIAHLVRDAQVLRKADFLIAKIWLSVLARRSGLFAFAGLIAVFGLGMANIAGLSALQSSVGAVRAATAIAYVDLLIAAIVLLIAVKSRPGPELDLALEVRKMAVASVQADTRDLKLTFDALAQDVTEVRANVTQFVQNPVDLAAQKILIPAALSIIKGMRSKHEHG